MPTTLVIRTPELPGEGLAYADREPGEPLVIWLDADHFDEAAAEIIRRRAPKGYVDARALAELVANAVMPAS